MFSSQRGQEEVQQKLERRKEILALQEQANAIRMENQAVRDHAQHLEAMIGALEDATVGGQQSDAVQAGIVSPESASALSQGAGFQRLDEMQQDRAAFNADRGSVGNRPEVGSPGVISPGVGSPGVGSEVPQQTEDEWVDQLERRSLEVTDPSEEDAARLYQQSGAEVPPGMSLEEAGMHATLCNPLNQRPCETCDKVCNKPGYNQCELICHTDVFTPLTSQRNYRCKRCAVYPAQADEEADMANPKHVLLTRMCYFHYKQFVFDWFYWFPPVPRRLKFLSFYHPNTKRVVNYLLHTCLLPKIHVFRKIHPVAFSKVNVQRFTGQQLLDAAEDIIDVASFYILMVSRRQLICEKATANIAEDYGFKQPLQKTVQQLSAELDEQGNQDQASREQYIADYEQWYAQARESFDQAVSQHKQRIASSFPACMNPGNVHAYASHYFAWNGSERQGAATPLLNGGDEHREADLERLRSPQLGLRLNPNLSQADLCLIIFRSIVGNSGGLVRQASITCGSKAQGCYLLPFEVSPFDTKLGLSYPFADEPELQQENIRMVAEAILKGQDHVQRNLPGVPAPMIDIAACQQELTVQLEQGIITAKQKADRFSAAHKINNLVQNTYRYELGMKWLNPLFNLLMQRTSFSSFRQCVASFMDMELPVEQRKDPNQSLCFLYQMKLNMDVIPSKVDAAIDMSYWKAMSAAERAQVMGPGDGNYQGMRDMSAGTPWEMVVNVIDTFHSRLELAEYADTDASKAQGLVAQWLLQAGQVGRFYKKELKPVVEALETEQQKRNREDASRMLGKEITAWEQFVGQLDGKSFKERSAFKHGPSKNNVYDQFLRTSATGKPDYVKLVTFTIEGLRRELGLADAAIRQTPNPNAQARPASRFELLSGQTPAQAGSRVNLLQAQQQFQTGARAVPATNVNLEEAERNRELMLKHQQENMAEQARWARLSRPEID